MTVRTFDYAAEVIDLARLGFAIAEVAAPRTDGSCSCRLRSECRAVGKHPVGHGWLRSALLNRRVRPDWLPAYARLTPTTSYGLVPVPGSGLLVVDRDDPEVLLPLPETYEVHRASAHPRKGHYYYRLPADIREDQVPRGFAGGEIRVAGSGHVVGPGCRHVSGDIYHSNHAAVGYADRDLIDALRALPPVRRSPDGEIEAVEGSRHDFLIRQARKLAGWGWDEWQIAEALREMNETLCIPPLTEQEAEFERMAAWAGTRVEPDRTIAIRHTRRASAAECRRG